MRYSVLPRMSLSNLLGFLVRLDDIQFDLLSQSIAGVRSFDVSEAEKERLSSHLDLSPNLVGHLVNAVGFLYRHVHNAEGNSPEIFSGKIDGLLDQLGVEDEFEQSSVALLKERLQSILTIAPNHELFLKISRLEEGFLPRVTSVSSFLDLRPSFDQARTKIEGFVPIVQLNIGTDSRRDDESNFVLQVDLNGLEILRSGLKEIEAKLNIVKEHRGLDFQLFLSDRDK